MNNYYYILTEDTALLIFLQSGMENFLGWLGIELTILDFCSHPTGKMTVFGAIF